MKIFTPSIREQQDFNIKFNQRLKIKSKKKKRQKFSIIKVVEKKRTRPDTDSEIFT